MKRVLLGDFANVSSGGTLDRKIAHNIETNDTYKVVHPGDYIISLRSFQGGLEYSEILGAVSPAYHVIQPIKDIDREFYRHYFKSVDFVSRLAVAVTGIRDGKQISFTDFGFIKLPYPHIDDQKRIGQLLSPADAELRLFRQQRHRPRSTKTRAHAATPYRESEGIAMRSPNDYLFCRGDLASVLDAQRRAVADAIHKLTPNQLTADNQAQVDTHFIDKHRIAPLCLKPEDLGLEEPREVETRAEGHFGSYIRKSLEFKFRVPFDGDAQLFALQPSQFTMNPPSGQVEGSSLILAFQREDRDKTAIQQELDRFLSSVQNYIGWQRTMLDQWNNSLAGFVKEQVQARREKLIGDRQLVDDLGFRIIRSGETPRATAVPIHRKSIIFAQHPSYVRQEHYAKLTSFRFILRSPHDPQRHLTVTLLAFNVPVES